MDRTTTAPAMTEPGMAEPGTGDARRGLWRLVSARLRILGWVLLLLALAGTAALLLQRRVLIEGLDDEIERGLVQEAEEVRVLAGGRNPQTGQPFGGDAAAVFDTFLRRNIPGEGETLLTFVDGRPYKATAGPYRLDQDPGLVRRWAGLTDSDLGEVSTPAGVVRYLAVPLADEQGTRGVFVVANFVRQERDEIDRTTQVGAVVYGSVLLMAVALAWFVAGRVLAPVRAVTETAKQATETDLSRRIPVPAADDEIAELARTFNSMLGRLERAFQDQRDFLNDAGHELRTPITIIRGHVELQGDDPSERRETRAIVLDELDRMARIVDDLLVLARAEEPDFLRRETVDLDVLTGELLAKAGALADRDWRLAATGHGALVADRQRLTQAVMNLLDNAARHSGPGSPIELGSALVGGEARLWVRDNGPGVAPEDHERIFGRFARARHGHGQAGAAGLGLAIVRAVAEAHGGRVDLESRPGAGATFTITIPSSA
jgi:signal transduction histidine kinase